MIANLRRTGPPMNIPRISVLGLMVAVALIGVVLGAFRVHCSVGSFVAGGIGIAVVRTHRKLGLDRPRGEAARNRSWFVLFAQSLAVAANLLCLAIVPCFLLVLMLVPNTFQIYGPPPETVVVAILISSLLGWPVSVLIRHKARWFA